jgi:hypothetical protein
MGLNMKPKEKITIACGLSLGVFAGACSIARTVELQSLSSMENYVYDTAGMLLWSSTEVCLTIVCACIPVLRPLYVRVRYGSQGSSGAKNSYPLKDYSDSKKSRGMGGTHPRSKVYMGPDGSILQTTVKGDNASEETILREQHDEHNYAGAWENEAGIKSTRDIRVTTTVSTREN